MTGDELLALTREFLRDTKLPYLWSDTIIYTYLTDAQRLVAERTHCLVNETDYSVSLTANTRSYTLDPEVLLVLGGKLDGESEPLRPGFAPAANTFFADTTGKPSRYTLAGGQSRISFSPTPDTSYRAKLIVAIRPTSTIGSGSTPEVPESVHTALAAYAASKCLLQNDVDGLNVASSEQYNMQFIEAVRDLKRQVYQYRMAPDANVIPPRIT